MVEDNTGQAQGSHSYIRTIWISGSLHNIYSVGMALEQEGFKILNNITWQKTNPAPNLSCRYFTHSTETILWRCHCC